MAHQEARRAGSPHDAEPGSRWWATPAVACIVFTFSLLLSVPVHSQYIVNWDGVQFALATEGFDLQHHRPHPPGYLAYVLVGTGLAHLTNDPSTSFVVLSVLSGAIAPILFLLLASQILPRSQAYATTFLFAASPLLWYYSGVGLTYAVEAALAVGFGLVAWHARQKQGRWIVAACIVLALLGAVRQTGAILLFPLFLWAIWPAAPRKRLRAIAGLGAASAVWLVPLVWLSGGPAQYVRESFLLAEWAAGETALPMASFFGIGLNWIFLSVSLLLALGSAVVLVLSGWERLPRLLLRELPGAERSFLLIWAAPPLAVFLFLHMGQAGYVLMLAPPLFLLAGKLSPQVVSIASGRQRAMVGGLVGINALIVLLLPGTMYRSLPPDTPLASHLRQYALQENDRHWRDVLSFIQRYDPDSTAVLTGSGGFRHLSYYLPEYHVFATGRDRSGGFGHLYTGYGRLDDYTMARGESAGALLPLPQGIERLVIADWMVKADFDFALSLTAYQLDSGASIWVATVPPETLLTFSGIEEAGPGARTQRQARVEARRWYQDEWVRVMDETPLAHPLSSYPFR